VTRQASQETTTIDDLEEPTSQTRRRMEKQQRRDTGPELALRRELHRRGLRYRVDYPALPDQRRRRVDIAFTRQRVAVFVHGCFWHGCPVHGTLPATNANWWAEKLAANRRRDVDSVRRLEALGWRVLTIWEHEGIEAADAVEAVVRAACDEN